MSTPCKPRARFFRMNQKFLGVSPRRRLLLSVSFHLLGQSLRLGHSALPPESFGLAGRISGKLGFAICFHPLRYGCGAVSPPARPVSNSDGSQISQGDQDGPYGRDEP